MRIKPSLVAAVWLVASISFAEDPSGPSGMKPMKATADGEINKFAKPPGLIPLDPKVKKMAEEGMARRLGGAEKSKSIQKIVGDYKAKKITRDEARELLRSPVERSLESELQSIPATITDTESKIRVLNQRDDRTKKEEAQMAKLQEKLDMLRRAKDDPTVLVDKRIEELLGAERE